MSAHSEVHAEDSRGNYPALPPGTRVTLEYLAQLVNAPADAPPGQVLRYQRRVQAVEELASLIDAWVCTVRPMSAEQVDQARYLFNWQPMSRQMKEKFPCAAVSVSCVGQSSRDMGEVAAHSVLAFTLRLPDDPQSPETDSGSDVHRLASVMTMVNELFTRRYGASECGTCGGEDYCEWVLPSNVRLRLSSGAGTSTMWVYDVHTVTAQGSSDADPPQVSQGGSLGAEGEPVESVRHNGRIGIVSIVLVLLVLAYPLVLLAQLLNLL